MTGNLSKRRGLPIAFRFLAFTAACGLIAACQPTVRVEAPKEPITINLNVKLDAEVRLKLEEQAREEVEANPEIF
ncbi:YnbE family lipoprotein [Denitrobaculum tricleocarpae]|uniref:YnbE family lipoprotein n=1 Tax=Denitrobaculum tricleocarpae TaxID=2591009 RepID=UPI001FEAB630|nr:YnbE family lipoprotein [Denitrobaculum tricleocarpae]